MNSQNTRGQGSAAALHHGSAAPAAASSAAAAAAAAAPEASAPLLLLLLQQAARLDAEAGDCRSSKPVRRPTLCMVPGCGKDLSSEGPYSRKKSCCQQHLRASLVKLEGLPCRFCQQRL
ncbi:hypothetical protein OEZ85_013462 [Tetradesmus obliquus]|uniref:SBP-type domain-containing protein n=1 Tax=Tetradesmus obliquus TaxID=3088 RepID=A0ABY8UTW6_TETOB|nr:hypothetical protein OEZ85_013462 [Tetradesmus obliquus]